jgi:flavoprotein
VEHDCNISGCSTVLAPAVGRFRLGSFDSIAYLVLAFADANGVSRKVVIGTKIARSLKCKASAQVSVFDKADLAELLPK